MKTRDILITVTRTLTGWHVYNDHQFGRITACDPQAGYEVTVNLPGSDTIRIVRTQYELVEDNTVLDTADMGEEQALDELARLLSSPMSRTDRLMRLKRQVRQDRRMVPEHAWRRTGGEGCGRHGRTLHACVRILQQQILRPT